MNSEKNNQWYEKTYLVVILCIIFFPVGLFALWKNSNIGKGWKIGVTALIVLIIIANIADKNKTSNTSIVDASSITETIKWSFYEDIDKMSSKKVYYASIDANEKLNFEFPYNGGSVATFTVRKKNETNDIYLSVSKGQFNSTFDGGQVRIKFDENSPRKYSFSSSSDNSSDIIFINSTSDVISRLKKSKKMIIETEFFNEGTRQIEFDVTGFKW